jgi:hypothetical protein
MTTYQLVPYLLTVTVRKSPDDIRPLADLDGKGTSLSDVVCKTMLAAKGRLFQDEHPHRWLSVTALHRADPGVFIELTPGRSGVQSSIVKTDGRQLDREFQDTEFTPVRLFMYCPSTGHHAILLAERVGSTGAMTMFADLLKQNFKPRFPSLMLKIRPAMTEDVIRKATEGQPIKALVFTRPRPIDSDGKLIEVAGESVKIEVRMRPRRNRKWLAAMLPKNSDQQLTRESLLGVLAPVIHREQSEDAALASLLEEGWQASIQIKIPGGTERLVNVGSSRAITMSFPIVPQGSGSEDSSGRPTNEQFRATCLDTLRLLQGQYSIDSITNQDCRWPMTQWTGTPDEQPWEVYWDGQAGITPTNS